MHHVLQTHNTYNKLSCHHFFKLRIEYNTCCGIVLVRATSAAASRLLLSITFIHAIIALLSMKLAAAITHSHCVAHVHLI